MKSNNIVTVTVNPSLDKNATFTGLAPEQKIHCELPHYDAGGGGINVSKAIHRLGGESLCIFTSGGPVGEMLEQAVADENINSKIIPVKNWTRENFIATETHTNAQYRFGFPGLPISETEQAAMVAAINNADPQFLVLSGSLNEKLPTDFYQKIAANANEKGAKVIVDASGDALRKVLETGVYLIKPNVGELAKLNGVAKLETDEVAAAAKKIIQSGGAEIVVVSLGPQGAVLVSKDETWFVPAPNVARKSTVGAGDSMVGGMVWALSQSLSFKEMIQWGVACGSAATMNEGTQLFKREDAQRLFNWLSNK